jgi:GAF domain-containing protein
MILTTNYDELIVDACKEAARDNKGLETNGFSRRDHKTLSYDAPSVFDWKDVTNIVTAMKDAHRQLILQLHGSINKGDSIVLTGRHYDKQIHDNKAFRDLLKWIFTTKTCVFVGASLEDADLLYLFQEARTDFGKHFGPHYALLPKSEAPEMRRKILDNDLNIKVILLDDSERVMQIAVAANSDWRTIAVSEFIRDLSGEVASLASPLLPTSDDVGFYFRKAINRLLVIICQLTGSFRGDFCFSKNGPRGHGSGRLFYFEHCGPTLERVRDSPVPLDSICGLTYFNATSQRGIYVENVLTMALSPDSKLSLYRSPVYLEGFPGVRSELSVPVEADGVRVGVLNIESRVASAYSDAHRALAIRFAEKAGRLYAASQRLNRRTRLLEPESIERAYDVLSDLLEQLADLTQNRASGSNKLAFLVYQADYSDGVLKAQD